MENRSHALVAGFFTIFFGLAAIVAIWWLGQSDPTTLGYVLETRGNVTGLNPQAQVRYRGIRAGKVESIEPDASVRIRVAGRLFELPVQTTSLVDP